MTRDKPLLSRRSIDQSVAGAFLAALLLVYTVAASAHVVLYADLVQAALRGIANHLEDTKTGGTEEAQLEALYLLGDRTERLVGLMNLDLRSHGKNLYADSVVERLQQRGVRVVFDERRQAYAYDLAAFREYLERTPRGNRAADARFQLLSHAFRASIGSDPFEAAGIDPDRLRKTIAEAEAFLRDYPAHDKVKEVHFFLATDSYRLARRTRDAVRARKYEEQSARVVREILEQYPGTPEARSAEVMLERIQRGTRPW